MLSAFLLGAAQAQSAPRTVNIGLGYIPNVQFTPFYVADKLGYFKAEGLNVKYQHGYISELMPLLLQGKLDFVVGDPGRRHLCPNVQGADIQYVMAVYQKVPVTVFSLPGKNIGAVADLKGKTVGIPGPFGSSYFALGALLDSAKLKESDIKLASIGFTQLDAVRSGKVDAAVGYVNNEVVQLAASGIKADTLDVTAAYPMVGVGMMTQQQGPERRPRQEGGAGRAARPEIHRLQPRAGVQGGAAGLRGGRWRPGRAARKRPADPVEHHGGQRSGLQRSGILEQGHRLPPEVRQGARQLQGD